MRGFVAAVAAVGTLVVFPTVGSAQVPNGDSAVGEATQCDPARPICEVFNTSVAVDAHSGPGGQAATGTVAWFVNGGATSRSFITGTVTCLAVSGHVAVVGFTGILQPADEPVAGLVRVTDGGGPGSAEDTFELTFLSGFPAPTAPDCTAPYPPGGTVHLNDRGDLIVTDSPALPTSKDQCKNGGWRSYGVFRNQGDCVSFVATKGKNPPADRP
jgi:hypothetical protein